ncbi:MAG: hypothetical protein GY769_21865 [bacterium]|nr:hypothetical protein [bacterium]
MSVALTGPAGPEKPRPAGESYALDFDPRLVEDAVLLRIDGAPARIQRLFRRHRDPLYEITKRDERESRFAELHGHWFVRLALVEPVHQALAREPSIAAGTSRCLVVPVVRAREEYADLKPDREAERLPTLFLGLRVATLVDAERLRPFLRRELLHIADMLDPEFGFEPQLPLLDDSAALENLVRRRYQALWDSTIDGRLAARGGLVSGGEEARRREFFGVFPMLAKNAERWFEHFFRGPRPNHAELVRFAIQPGAGDEVMASDRCALCRMPSAGLHPDPARLAPETIQAICRDFADWEPARGVCLQCADLYGARGQIDPEPLETVTC